MSFMYSNDAKNHYHQICLCSGRPSISHTCDNWLFKCHVRIFKWSESHGRKKPININNFAGLSRKWVGVKLFMCFPFSWGKRETHKQNSQEISGKGRDSPGIIPGQSRENFVYVFSCLLVFPGPNKSHFPQNFSDVFNVFCWGRKRKSLVNGLFTGGISRISELSLNYHFGTDSQRRDKIFCTFFSARKQIGQISPHLGQALHLGATWLGARGPRVSERKIWLWEGLWEGLWKTSKNLWNPLKPSAILWNPSLSETLSEADLPLRDSRSCCP